jgi:hypothetical protein
MLMRGWGFDYNEVRAQHAPDLVKVRIVSYFAAAVTVGRGGEGLEVHL